MSLHRRLRPLLQRLWQALPRRARRRAFIAATAFAAPRPARPMPPAAGTVAVAGVLRNGSGLGESARMNLAALQHLGRATAAVDLSGSWLGAAELPMPGGPLVAATGPGALIVHTSGPFLPYALRRAGREIVAGKRVIGFWHWELERLPADWQPGCRFAHEVWVPSRFCRDAVATRFDGPIRIVPHPVDVSAAPPSAPERPAQQPFTVVTMFNMASGFARKNPLATVAAFSRAFGSDPGARLIVKTMNAEAWPAGLAALEAAAAASGGTIVIERSLMPRAGVLALIAGADAVCSLHRSEGFGLLAAEAMLLGRPVLATDWSATTDFLTAETGVPIPYRLRPAEDPQRTYHFPHLRWAEADIDAAAAALVRLRADPAAAAALGAAGQAAARRLFSLEAYEAAIGAALDG